MSAISSSAIVTVATAQTTETAQRALNLRGNLAVATVVLVAWLFSHITGFRARAYLWGFTIASRKPFPLRIVRAVGGRGDIS